MSGMEDNGCRTRTFEGISEMTLSETFWLSVIVTISIFALEIL